MSTNGQVKEVKVELSTVKAPKVLIGIPGAEGSRFGEFYDYFNQLAKPEGTAVIFVRGQSPARNRNIIFEKAIEVGAEFILLLDDDMAFKPDLLAKLMSHDKDVVTGIYLKRNFPHEPLIFDTVDDRGYAGYHWLRDTETSLVPIVNCGFGGVLIRTEILKKMEKPWVRLGELEKVHWCDDIGFFNRLRKEVPEVEMYCDLDAKLGHMANVVVWPNYINGKWYTTYNSNGIGEVNIPAVQPAPAVPAPKELAGVGDRN